MGSTIYEEGYQKGTFLFYDFAESNYRQRVTKGQESQVRVSVVG